MHAIHEDSFHWTGRVNKDSVKRIVPIMEIPVNIKAGELVFVPSKQCILLFGGYDHNSVISSEIYMFSLLTQKWKKIQNLEFTAYGFGAMLTSNEGYVVLMGGINDEECHDNNLDDIFVLDVRNEDDSKWELKKSSIKCPKKGYCEGLRTGGVDSKDEILVIGFIKDCFKQKEFDNMQLPPSYIMKMVTESCSAEMIHWMEYDGDHYGIYLRDILMSLR